MYNRIIVSTIHYAQLDGIKYFEVSSDVAKFAVDINQILAMSSDNILDFANQSSKVKAKYGVGIWKKQWKLLSKNEKTSFIQQLSESSSTAIGRCFYELLGDSFAFVATMPVDDLELKGGKDYSSREYCVVAAKDCTSKALAMNLARTSEICIFGAQSLDYAIERAKQPNCGLSFEFGERWLKRGWINVLSPHLVKWWFCYQKYFRDKPFYKLNASAFAVIDHYKLHTYGGRCYKWGYFTALPEIMDAVKSKKKHDSKDSSNNVVCKIFEVETS